MAAGYDEFRDGERGRPRLEPARSRDSRHQRATTRIAALLDHHVRQHHLVTVLVAPMDVVLDADRDLVLQPDVMFISQARSGIIRDFVRGAPDLVVEITSPGTERYDRNDKVRWYRAYGVRECWLLDTQRQVVTVFDLSSNASGLESRGAAVVRSNVMPMLPHRQRSCC